MRRRSAASEDFGLSRHPRQRDSSAKMSEDTPPLRAEGYDVLRLTPPARHLASPESQLAGSVHHPIQNRDIFGNGELAEREAALLLEGDLLFGSPRSLIRSPFR